MKDSEPLLKPLDSFVDRHIGPSDEEIQEMLSFIGVPTLDELVSRTVPENIRTKKPLALSASSTEHDELARLRKIANRNKVYRTYLGMGYSDCITPAVIQRNILENPGWYTAYTPYQSEIAQGRLEALLNYQTMVSDLTGLEVANASLLDEATAAAEAMALAFAAKGRDTAKGFFVSELCHPQTIQVLKTRAEPLGIRVILGDHRRSPADAQYFGALLQYPGTDGSIHDYRAWIDGAKKNGVIVAMAADILALTLLTPPGELGADIAVGSTQRLGVPLGYGGPHAAYFATRDAYKRIIPGRIVGVSQDAEGRPAIRLALQTREQHIRRDKATSNICTAQVLLAVIASMYACYHGPKGLKKIASRVLTLTQALRSGLSKLGYSVGDVAAFDTLHIQCDAAVLTAVLAEAKARQINLRVFDKKSLGISLDETTGLAELTDLLEVFAKAKGGPKPDVAGLIRSVDGKVSQAFERKSAFLTHPVFNRYHSETEMLRYLHKLQNKDLSLTHSMIPLGSCTMKLNATAEMYPVTWAEFGKIHPFAPTDQVEGYRQLIDELEKMLAEITGFPAVSVQPNAGSQGEYAGLLVVRKYHESRGQPERDVCLIPKSAHGTNPASAAMAGMRIVVVECDDQGNVDLNDLRAKAQEHSARLSALMITYPSTHGVFEESIREICEIVHKHGGQIYMDGANMNAQIGLCRPGEFGPDVCHLNLHKTFCIPHGGGGPGMGPIGVQAHLKEFLPGHPVVQTGGRNAIGAVSAAPYGSASILPISWMYVSMMGAEGLKKATEVAILNANYLAKKLEKAFPVLYRGKKGFVAHECIFDLRQLKDSTGVDVEDVAKRLMDYGYHAPTVSFPVAGTMMVEPTESESKHELDRFIQAMLSIREEIAEVESGKADQANNLLKNAPHTATQIAAPEWNRPYTRERAVFPVASLRDGKFWPSVARINNVAGDRNLVCTCPSIEEYA